MKKTKFLVAAVAMLGLGVAAAASGTVAWFIATQAASYDTVVGDTEAIGTKASTLTLGKFTLTAVVGEPDVENVSLTDTSGNSYVYGGGNVGEAGTGKVSAVAVDPVSTISCALQVSYTPSGSDPMPSASDIGTIWKATIGAHDVNISVTSDANVRFLASASPSGSGWAGTVGTTGVSLTALNANLLALAFNGSTGVSTSNVSAGSVYVAVTGQEVVEVAANHTITFSPVNPS